MPELEFQNKPVRVSLPASVAADLGNFKKTLGSILDKLGCPACCSGHDIHFDLQRDFVFREISDTAIPVSTHATAGTRRTGAANHVGVHPKVANDLDSVFLAVDRIAEFTGCRACCSGHDLFLHMERNFVIDERMNIEQPMLRFG